MAKFGDRKDNLPKQIGDTPISVGFQEQCVSITEFKKYIEAWIDWVDITNCRICITRWGKPYMYLLPWEEYERLAGLNNDET